MGAHDRGRKGRSPDETRLPGRRLLRKRKVIFMMVLSVNKTWFDDCPHDLLLWSLGVVSESFYILNEQLVIHRRHDNTNTPSNKKTKDTRLYNVKIQIDLSESILHNYDLYSSNKFILDEITRYLDVLRERYKLILSGNVFSFSLMLGKYIRYYSVKTMVGDLISSFR